jgi:hypothetical protein
MNMVMKMTKRNSKDEFMENVELCFVRHLADNNYSITKRIVARDFDEIVNELCDIRWNDILRNESRQYRKERRQRRLGKINPILPLIKSLLKLIPQDEFEGRYKK